jgi:hypothetical protein
MARSPGTSKVMARSPGLLVNTVLTCMIGALLPPCRRGRFTVTANHAPHSLATSAPPQPHDQRTPKKKPKSMWHTPLASSAC